ncbi:expressed unknown protein [Seminavis robusta]|uniref:Uncharacterized protein n=1 Tax=Seminavis robusta TaxID=568900 RepID=A0A9N8HK43_9STRA|nr:expressed unknown protein [Seminavis robusta]|eukprot:Sro911_g219270.1 n/a (102) ;mRNA; r:35112-35417
MNQPQDPLASFLLSEVLFANQSASLPAMEVRVVQDEARGHRPKKTATPVMSSLNNSLSRWEAPGIIRPKEALPLGRLSHIMPLKKPQRALSEDSVASTESR